MATAKKKPSYDDLDKGMDTILDNLKVSDSIRSRNNIPNQKELEKAKKMGWVLNPKTEEGNNQPDQEDSKSIPSDELEDPIYEEEATPALETTLDEPNPQNEEDTPLEPADIELEKERELPEIQESITLKEEPLATQSIPETLDLQTAEKDDVDQNVLSDDFFLPAKNEKNSGKLFNYRLKEHEIEPFDDLMLILRTQSPGEGLRFIITRVFNDYGKVIQEEAALNQKITEIQNNPNITEIEDIEDIIDTSNEEVRQKRLERIGLFTAPPPTRGINTGRSAACTLNSDQLEMLDNLMIALDVNKPSTALRWILNTFIDDYSEPLHKKAEIKRRAEALLSGKQ